MEDVCVGGVGGVHTANELAHFYDVSTGDGSCGGECGRALQHRWLWCDDDW